eukprot:sb/3473423/
MLIRTLPILTYLSHPSLSLPPDDALNRVSGTLDRISKPLVAASSFHCGAYQRALMYLESRGGEGDEEPNWALLHSIYSHMGIAEGVAGVTASRTTPATLREQIQGNNSIVVSQELTDTSKQPIRTCYLVHVTGYQLIRDQYFFVRSVPVVS